MCQNGLFEWAQRPRSNAAKPRGEAWRGQGSSGFSARAGARRDLIVGECDVQLDRVNSPIR